MTIFVRCDKCGTTEEFKDGHYLPLGWHTECLDIILSRFVKEKHFCDSCWKRIKEEKE